MSQTKVIHLVWNAGKDVYAGNSLVEELGPMMAVQEMAKTLIKTNPKMSEFDAVNMSSNVLQYHTMLAQGCMPCHATRQRVNTAKKRASQKLEASREEKTSHQGNTGVSE